MPSAFVLLDALPLTANGKVDRTALPASGARGRARRGVRRAAHAARAGAGPASSARCSASSGWACEDNFFDLGGHSLLATQLVSRLTQGHGIAVTLQMVFDAKDLRELADRIVEAELASADTGFLDEALREMQGLSPEELQAMLEQVEGKA